MIILELLNTVAAACGVVVAVDKASTVLKKHGANVKDRILKLRGIQIESSSPIEGELKDEVAIAVDFGGIPMKNDVETYLKANNIDATLLICSNAKGRIALDLYNEDDWKLAVKEINGLIKAMKEKSFITKVHLFISGPVALAFAVGYVSRTIDPYLYQLNRGDNVAPSRKYAPVMKISDGLVW